MGSLGGLGTVRYFGHAESERIDAMLDRNRRRLGRKARRFQASLEAAQEELDEVAADLGRAVLLAMAVNHVLVGKRVLHPDEIAAVARKLDLSDGVADGKLDPAVFRPPGEAPEPPPADPKDFLHHLEEEP